MHLLVGVTPSSVGCGPIPEKLEGPMSTTEEYESVLPDIVVAAQAAGAHLRERFTPDARPADLDDIISTVKANDEASMAFLREPLARARPGAAFLEDELATGDLPPGEWWVTDPVEGNINHL